MKGGDGLGHLEVHFPGHMTGMLGPRLNTAYHYPQEKLKGNFLLLSSYFPMLPSTFKMGQPAYCEKAVHIAPWWEHKKLTYVTYTYQIYKCIKIVVSTQEAM